MRAVPALEQVLSGAPSAVAAAITLAERGDERVRDLISLLRSRAGGAYRVGFTGPAGAGKSSLLREVLRCLRAGGERIGVVACDPVSPLTGGAFFGDRVRLAAVAEDAGVFFRSVGHRGRPGEPCRGALDALAILDAAGFPWVFLETVGTGQTEVGALGDVALKVLLHDSDAGDEIQMLKAGLVETADLHVVGKGDRPGARAWAGELEAALSTPGETAPVFLVSAATGEGVGDLVAELKARRDVWRVRRVATGGREGKA